tara:strand:- start:1486 stop:1890 length:405 start_codon:yes stop_codon:yes gene_type:complete
MKYLLILMLAASCNAITPDRFGIGMSEGNMNAFGKSNKFMKNQPNEMEMDFRGDTESTMIWLEWDLPSFEEPTDYDRFLRERIRTLNLEKELLIQERDIRNVILNIDKALEQECTPAEREVEGVWPKKLTNLYG